jgi:ABC-type transport system involved in multi-copper enzyme maturation permease subunit
MIRNLFRAEWQKLAGHRWAAGLLIWLFPVGAAALMIIGLLVAFFSPDTVANLGLPVAEWPAQMVNFWQISSNPLARLMLMGFAAVTFGGEYQWQTWKNVVPRQSRTALVLVKFVTLGLFITISFGVASLVWGLGLLAIAALTGGDTSLLPAYSSWADFLASYGITAVVSFAAVMIAVSYAVIGALLTRTVLGAAIVGFTATMMEELSPLFVLILQRVTGWGAAVDLYRLTPTFTLSNIGSWLSDGRAFTLPGFDYTPAGLGFSVLVLIGWLLGLLLVATLIFQRQDITS